MASDLVRIEIEDAVAILRLNSPDTRNALDDALLDALGVAAESIDSVSVRVVILTGEGRAFGSGANIKQMSSMGFDSAKAYSRLGNAIFRKIETLPMPTIAAVNGFAFGGACELALACDWIYSSSDAVFGQPEVCLGIIPGFGGTSRLLHRVKDAWAKELILGGQKIGAKEALEIGLVNRLFEPDTLLPETICIAKRIASNGPRAVQLAKEVIRFSQESNAEDRAMREQQAFGSVFTTHDAKEGLRAFLEKREPTFLGH